MTQVFDTCGRGSIPLTPAKLDQTLKAHTDRVVEALKLCGVNRNRSYELSQLYGLDTKQLAELFGISESEAMMSYLRNKRGVKDIYDKDTT